MKDFDIIQNQSNQICIRQQINRNRILLITMLSWLKTAVVDIYMRRHPIKRNSRLIYFCLYNSESKVSEKIYMNKYILTVIYPLSGVNISALARII